MNNTKNIPQIGFGTWKLPNTDETIETIINAVNCRIQIY